MCDDRAPDNDATRPAAGQSVTGVQNVSRMCMVCGAENPYSLKARFLELEAGELIGIFAPLEEHQSYPGRLHGGISSAILDEAIGRAMNLTEPDTWGVTVELSVKYRKPVPLDKEIRAVARITGSNRRTFEGTGEIVLEDGTVAVEASGRYFKMPIESIAEGDFDAEWREDSRPLPEGFTSRD